MVLSAPTLADESVESILMDAGMAPHHATRFVQRKRFDEHEPDDDDPPPKPNLHLVPPVDDD